MGNCMRKNKVEPCVMEKTEEEIARRTPRRTPRGLPDNRPAKTKHADMVQDLMEEGTTPNVGKAGLSFVVDFDTPPKKGKGKMGKKPRKPKTPDNLPPLKAPIAGPSSNLDMDLPDYTAEEKELMVSIMRDANIKERVEAAKHHNYIKMDDARRKRMGQQYIAKCEGKEKEKEKELKAEAAREEKARKQQEKARQAEMKAIAVRRRKMALEMVAEEAKKDGEDAVVAPEEKKKADEVPVVEDIEVGAEEAKSGDDVSSHN